MNFWLVGNLGRIDYVNDNEYDLFIRPDTCCPRFRCWFLFTVENVKADQVRRKTKKIFDFIGKCLRLFRELFSILWIFPKRNLCIETVWHLWWNQPVENDGKSGLAIDWIIIRWNFLFQATFTNAKCFLLPLSWSSKELRHVIYLLFRSRRWCLSICIFFSIYLHETSKLSREYRSTTIGLRSTSTTRVQCGKIRLSIHGNFSSFFTMEFGVLFFSSSKNVDSIY